MTEKNLFIVVMGASGCGKTTIGEKLAKEFQIPFLDSDKLHPASNLNKMKSGIPLNDEDRLDWLKCISRKINQTASPAIAPKPDGGRHGLIIGCSALRLKYRRILSGFCLNYDSNSTPPIGTAEDQRNIHFLYLKGSFEALKARVDGRVGHFMPPSLLQSQLDTLEEPTDEELIDNRGNVRGKIFKASIDSNPDFIVSTFVKFLEGLNQQNTIIPVIHC